MDKLKNVLAFVDNIAPSDRAFWVGVVLLVVPAFSGNGGAALLLGLPFVMVSLICEAIERHKPTVIIHTQAPRQGDGA